MYSQSHSSLKKRWTDFASFVFLFLLLLLAITRLEITHWADNLSIAGWLIIIGVVLGYIVGASRIKSGWSALIVFFYSLLIVPAIVIYDMTSKAAIIDRFVEIWDRIYTAATQLLANQPVTDSILFIIGMGLLYWIMGTLAGFTLPRKGNPWIPVLVLGGAMILIEHYQVGERKQFYTAAYAVVSLILLGRLYFLRIRDELRSQEIKVGDEASFDFTRGVIIAALIIGLAGWIIPSVARAIFVPSEFPTALSVKWDNFTRNFEHLVFALNENNQTLDTTAGNIMDLGTGQVLGLNVVLNVEASQLVPLNNAFYWRLRAYDIYTSSQWTTGPVYSEYFSPSENLPVPQYKNLLPVQLRFTSSMSQMNMLYVPGIPVVISKEVQATFTAEGGSQADVLAIFTSPPIGNGGAYRATADVSSAGAAELAAAGTDYPQWILDRYLELPTSLPQRMRDLSAQITASGATPYDKTVAVTNYLRGHITYQTTIQAPPANRDAIDWFLFDYKKGFCNYYASAEVLLLRAAGIPARLAVGYAQGVETSRGRFSVREKDSHAWPEVFFPGYGWIPFEPTSAISSVDYTGAGGSGSSGGTTGQAGGSTPGPLPGLNGEDRALQLLDRLDSEISGITPAPQLTLFGKILLGVGIATILALITLLAITFKKHRKAITGNITRTWKGFYHALTRLPLLGDVFLAMSLGSAESSFLAIERGLAWLGVHMPAGATAAEVAAELVKELPDTKKDAQILLKAYQETVYGKNKKENPGGTVAAFRINLAVTREYFRRLFVPVQKLNDRFS